MTLLEGPLSRRRPASTFPALYELGPEDGTLTIHTGRAGMAARAGHDLVLEAERWTASIALKPSAPAESQVRVTVDATSLEVREGHGGVKPLTDSDCEEIRRNLERKVLRTDRHPEITFVSTGIDAVDGERWLIAGDLTIAGTTSSVQIPLDLEQRPDRTLMRATVTIAQSSFGIKPFSAMMGALKVADDVEIRAEAGAPPLPAS